MELDDLRFILIAAAMAAFAFAAVLLLGPQYVGTPF